MVACNSFARTHISEVETMVELKDEIDSLVFVPNRIILCTYPLALLSYTHNRAL